MLPVAPRRLGKVGGGGRQVKPGRLPSLPLVRSVPRSCPSCQEGAPLLGHPLPALLNACSRLRRLGTVPGAPILRSHGPPPSREQTSGIWASLSIFTGFPFPIRGYTEGPVHWGVLEIQGHLPCLENHREFCPETLPKSFRLFPPSHAQFKGKLKVPFPEGICRGKLE